MPYALFCNESKLSKTYPTEADVWKLARQSGLVVDAVSEAEKAAPRPVRITTTRSDPVGRTRMRIRPRTRPRRSGTPNWNSS